jgi:glycosyltransferase involved in cell wall biosynthesis
MTLRVAALVPAHDEEATIGVTVKALLGLEEVAEVTVVADGCSDRTAEEAAAAGARVLVPPERLGKGGAVEGALDGLPPADVYVLVDGDVGDTAAEMRHVLEAVLTGRADLAVARFPPLDGGGFGLVKRTAAWSIRAACGFDADEPLSGQRAVRRAVLDACRPLAGGFGLEVGMTIDATRLGVRIEEVPVAMSHRATGRGPTGFAHRGRQGADVARAVLPRLLRIR